jgi:hypothetical protein
MFQSRAKARAASVTARFSATGSLAFAKGLRHPIGVCEGLRLGCIRAIALSNVRLESSAFTDVDAGAANFFGKVDMFLILFVLHSIVTGPSA